MWEYGGIELNKERERKLMDTDNSVVIARGRGVEGGGEGCRGVNGDGGRHDLGGEHTVRCTDGMLWNCAPDTCEISLASLTSINSTKKERGYQYINFS